MYKDTLHSLMWPAEPENKTFGATASVPVIGSTQNTSSLSMRSCVTVAQRNTAASRIFIKHNENKLKFVVNLIGDNLSYPYPGSTISDQRLNNKNISEVFLVQRSEPIELPLLELTSSPIWDLVVPQQRSAGGANKLKENNASLHSIKKLKLRSAVRRCTEERNEVKDIALQIAPLASQPSQPETKPI